MSQNGFYVGNQLFTPFPYKIYPTLMRNSFLLDQNFQKSLVKGLRRIFKGRFSFEGDYLLQR
jgi:hypothetical protein